MPSPPRAALLLLRLSAAYQVYAGLSSILLPFFGDPVPGLAAGAWTVAAGALQFIATVLAFVRSNRPDVRCATLALAACILLGWLAALPSTLQQGLDFSSDAGLAAGFFLLAPAIAFTAAALARWSAYPILAAFIVTVPTSAGILFVVAFAVAIAIHGF